MANNETPGDAPVSAIVEMLRRELEASKSVTDHIQFLRNLASGEPMSEGMRAHLTAHIAEEESEHQAHLARLVPALERLAARLEGGPGASTPGGTAAPPAASSLSAPASGLTVGDLAGKRPWFVGRGQ